MIKYRVILKVSYNEAWFEFEDGAKAVDFAKTALESMVNNKDMSRKSYVSVQVVDVDLENAEEKE